MKILVWNAFASNNSGSYLIVGSFESASIADSVAKELAEVCSEHSKWYKAAPYTEDTTGSPIHAFSIANNLRWGPSFGGEDDWPQYGKAPRVEAFDNQVIVAVDCTVSMPTTFGQFFYARGGRVATEIDHGHHPIVTEICLWWPYNMEASARAAAADAAIGDIERDNDLLTQISPSNDTALRAHLRLVIKRDATQVDPYVTIAAIFNSVVDGVRAVTSVAERYEASYRVRLYEALDGHDPLAHLRDAGGAPSG